MKYLKYLKENVTGISSIIGGPFLFLSNSEYFAIKRVDEKLFFYIYFQDNWVVKSDITEGCSIILSLLPELINNPKVTEIEISKKDKEKVIKNIHSSNPKFWLRKGIKTINNIELSKITIDENEIVNSSQKSKTLGDLLYDLKMLVDKSPENIENTANKFGL